MAVSYKYKIDLCLMCTFIYRARSYFYKILNNLLHGIFQFVGFFFLLVALPLALRNVLDFGTFQFKGAE